MNHRLFIRVLALLVILCSIHCFKGTVEAQSSDLARDPTSELVIETSSQEQTRTRPIWSLFGTGLGVFFVPYIANIAGSFAWVGAQESAVLFGTVFGLGSRGSYDTAPYLTWSLVPLIGSFAQVPISNEFIGDDWVRGMHIITGAVQWIGLTIAIVGLIAREPAPPRRRRAERAPEIEVWASPIATYEHTGLAFGGAF
jgi:hypothetical protein